MTHIVDEKFTADEILKGCKRMDIRNLRKGALKGCFVDGKLAVTLHADAQRISALHGFGHHRDHASDRRFGESDMRIEKTLFSRREECGKRAVHVDIGIEQVFADDNIEGREILIGPALAKAFCDHRQDLGKDMDAYRCSHQIRMGDRIHHGRGVRAVNTIDVFNPKIRIAIRLHDGNWIAMVAIDAFN